jgi:hypothetical protein
MIIIIVRFDKSFSKKKKFILFIFQPSKTPDSYQDRRNIKVQIDHLLNTTRVPPSTTEKNIRSKQILAKSNTDERSSPILRGQKSQLTIYEPLEELNDEIRAARQYVQNIKDESHSKQRKRVAEMKENNTLNRQPSRHHTLDDRLLRTIHGSMAFGCLVAIDKAYSDRSKIEKRKILAQDVEQTRQEHSYNTAQIQVRY